MHKLSRPLQGHARLKVRAAVGSALPRRRFQATQARSAAAATDAAPVAGTSDSIKSLLRAYNPKEEIRVPAPLHPEQRRTSLTQHTVYPASATIEQLSMLEVCLATGNVARARKIYAALANLYAKEAASAHAASEDYDDFDPVSGQWRKAVAFSDVVPTTIHAQFLRAYFRQAIVNDRAAQAIVNDQASANDKASGNDKASVKDKASGKDKASVKDKKTTAKDKASGNNKASVNDKEAIAKDEASTNDTAYSKDKATEEGKAPVKSKTGYILKKKASVAQAWEWFDMVLQNERQYGRMDDSAWAVMFKGMVATGMANPVGFKGHGRGIKPISHLYYLLKEQGRSFYNVLNNPIFSHSGLAGLNDHSAVEVCEKLAAVLAEQGETDALVEVDKVRQDLLGSVDYIPSSNPEHSAQDSKASSEGQDAENGGSSSSPLKPAKRTENEQAPFKLGSLVANLDAVQSQRTVSTDPYVRQDLLEESAYDAALWQSLHEHDHLEKIGLGTKIRMKGSFIQENMARWRAALTERLEEDFRKAAEPKTPVKGFYGGFSGDENLKNLLGLLTPANLAHVTVVEILRAASIFTGIVDGVRLARAVVLLGRAVETEYGAHAWKALHPDLYEQKVRKIASEERKAHAIRNFMQEQGIAAGAAKEARIQGYGDEADELLKIDDPEERQIIEEARKRAMPWTQKMRAKVGGYLLKQLLETAYVERTAAKRDGSGEIVTEKQPAFWQSYQYFRSQRVGIIKLNPAVAEKMDSDRLGSVAFPRFLPMLVKPKPWTGFNSGGYRIHSTPLVRMKESPEQEQYVRLAAENGQMKEVFAALDALGSTAWRINKSIYDVVVTVWNSGEPLGDIPMDQAERKLVYPVQPSIEAMEEPSVREAYRNQCRDIRIERARHHSMRCTLNYKLEIAKAFLNETFYFPHNIDFRGRAYPIPPHLSHISDDITRALLQFAEGRPLGKRGLTWLHIHLANTAGFDKASLHDRENFAKEHIEDIMDSADHPLDGKRWWLSADDPWQCLAACMELTQALRSPDPEAFISHIPVQQDGTCNGLQHYAALGGDRTGAEQVNLAVGDKPADVYTAVANLVNKEIQKDLQKSREYMSRSGAGHSKEGEEVWDIARALEGKVTRKVVKQTVMTTVYGVTFVGAKRQIQRQLKDRGDIDIHMQYPAATYLAEKVLSCIGDLFKGASGIQLWLGVCARLIGRAVLPQGDKSPDELFKNPMASVIWTTPLGLPVAQPYRKVKKAQIITALQSIFITDPNLPTSVDTRAQATAFPPNYIHSLDATHMMMTAIECKRRGLVYASVHDSYWTHACDVDEMSAALRDCFIELHSRDLLGELKSGFQERYKGYVIRQKAMKGLHIEGQEATDKENGQSAARSALMDLGDIAAEYGPSALPPLAVAGDEKLLAELRDREKKAGSSTTDAELEEVEEDMFRDEEEESEMDVDAEIEPQGEAEEPEVVEAPKRGKGRPPKSTVASAKDSTASKSKGKSKSKKAKTQKETESLTSTVFPGSKTRVIELSSAFPEIPPRGDFDLEMIRHSPYFFN